MNAVQFKADYKDKEQVSAGTIVLHDNRLFMATKETKSNPEDDTVWAEIGEISKPTGSGFFDGLFSQRGLATPNNQGNTEEVDPRSAVKPNTGTQLNFTQLGGKNRRRRRTTKKPRRK